MAASRGFHRPARSPVLEPSSIFRWRTRDALYVRSHYDTVSVSYGDAPRADEVVIAFAFATRGRLHARLGGLDPSEVRGDDGLH